MTKTSDETKFRSTPEIVTTNQAAKLLGIRSKQGLMRYVHDGILHPLTKPKTGTATLFRVEDVLLAKVAIEERREARKPQPPEQTDFRDGTAPDCYCGKKMVKKRCKGDSSWSWAYCSEECRAIDTWETCKNIIENGRRLSG